MKMDKTQLRSGWSRCPAFVIKVFKWEFWPVWVMYFPVFIYYFWLAAKARNLYFFTGVNPGMEAGGLFGASKFRQLALLPPELKPVTVKITAGSSYTETSESVARHGIQYPFIAKPDRAERGVGVSLITGADRFEAYAAASAGVDYVVQQYIDYEFEAGVFYHRMPGQPAGKVTSVVIKQFLSITGDGTSTLEQLVRADYRAKVVAARIKAAWASRWFEVIPAGDRLLLEPIGNHNRGTAFINGNHLLSEELDAVFDRIAAHLPGFYYGRFDLRCTSAEDLMAGNNIKIVEVNGANAEPAHIYDPSGSVVEGFKTVFSYWNLMYKIARANHARGFVYGNFAGLLPVYRQWKSVGK